MRASAQSKITFDDAGELASVFLGKESAVGVLYGELLSNDYALHQKIKEVISALRSDPDAPVSYPCAMELNRINNVPSNYQFIQELGPEGHEAWLGCSNEKLQAWREVLSFRDLPETVDDPADFDRNLTTACGEGCFAIRVRGARYVKALAGFDATLRSGGASLEYKNSGVELVNTSVNFKMQGQDYSQRQAVWESSLRLYACSESEQIFKSMQELSGMKLTGWLSASLTNLRDGFIRIGDSEVLYNVRGFKDQPFDWNGNFSKQQLLDWAASKFSYRLGGDSPTPEDVLARPTLSKDQSQALMSVSRDESEGLKRQLNAYRALQAINTDYAQRVAASSARSGASL